MPDAEKRGANRSLVYNSEGIVSVGETISGPLAVPLAGARVVQCRLDHALTFVVDEDQPGRGWTMRLEAGFSLVASDGSRRWFDDDAPPSGWAPAVALLLHAEVADAEALADGTLVVRFQDGSKLEAPPIPQYEAWQIEGPEGLFAVCGPSGELSRWRPATDADR